MWEKYSKNCFVHKSKYLKLCLSNLRDQNTKRLSFIENSDKVTSTLIRDAVSEQEMSTETRVSGCNSNYEHSILKNPKICFISILRSAEAMVFQGQILFVDAAVGHILIQRDHDTAEPVYFYHKFPADILNREIYVLDPMLATGGSVCKTFEK